MTPIESIRTGTVFLQLLELKILMKLCAKQIFSIAVVQVVSMATDRIRVI